MQNERRFACLRVDRLRNDRERSLNAVDFDERRRFVGVRDDRKRQRGVDRVRRDDKRTVFQLDVFHVVGERKFRRGGSDVKLLIVSFGNRAVFALGDDRQFRRLRAGQVGLDFVNVRRAGGAAEFDRNAFEPGRGVNLVRQLRTGVFGGKFERFRFAGDHFDFGRNQRVEFFFVDDFDGDFLELRRAVRGGSGDGDRRFAGNAFARDEPERAVFDFVRFENANVFELVSFDRLRLFARRVRDDFRFLDLVDNVVTVDDVTENVVTAVEPRRFVERDVNLRVARVRAFVRERDDSGAAVRQQVGVFVGDRLTGAFVARAVRGAALEHKAGINAVERFPFVIAVVDQLHKVRRGVRRFAFRFEELQNDFAERRDRAVGRRFRNGKRDLRSGRERSGQTFERSGVDDLRVGSFERVMIGVAGRYRDRVRKGFERPGAVEELARLQNFKQTTRAKLAQRLTAAGFALSVATSGRGKETTNLRRETHFLNVSNSAKRPTTRTIRAIFSPPNADGDFANEPEATVNRSSRCFWLIFSSLAILAFLLQRRNPDASRFFTKRPYFILFDV